VINDCGFESPPASNHHQDIDNRLVWIYTGFGNWSHDVLFCFFAVGIVRYVPVVTILEAGYRV
jgi:hypothetical protein